MLVLTRKINESVIIGDDIEVCVTRVEGDTVKIGIRAPRSIPIFRKELVEDVKTKTLAAAVPDHSNADSALPGLRSLLVAKKHPGD